MTDSLLLLKNMLLDIECLLVLISIILLIIYWKRSEKNQFLICYTFYQISVIFFVSSHILIHLNKAIFLKQIYFSYMKNISFIFAEFSCIILFWIFTNPKTNFNRKLALIFILPAIYIMLIITNHWHRIIGTSIIKPNDVILKKTILCLVIEYIIVLSLLPVVLNSIKKLIKMRGYKLIQGLLILSALSVPGILYGIRKLLDIDILPGLTFDPVPAAMSASTILLGVAALRYRIISLIPFAFKEFAESINSPLIVLDNNNRIQYYNTVLSKVFSMVKIEKQQHLKQFLHQLEVCEKNNADIDAIRTIVISNSFTNIDLEVCLFIPEETFYKVSIQVITAYGDEQVGKLISFTDITDYKNLAIVQAELAATKTRIEISRDAHDIIGYAMTNIIMHLQNELANLSNEEIRQRDSIINILTMAREKNEEFRKILYKNCNTHSSCTEVECANYRDKLLCRLKNIKDGLGDERNLSYDLDDHLIIPSEKYFNVLDRICLEGVTNSIKHGEAKNIETIIKHNSSAIQLKMFDDGYGCKNINKGIGLTSMTERINEIGGTLQFKSDIGSGFIIFVNLPIIEETGNSYEM